MHQLTAAMYKKLRYADIGHFLSICITLFSVGVLSSLERFCVLSSSLQTKTAVFPFQMRETVVVTLSRA